ncbi:putative disease resistance RPP13-like protein 3 [Abrus precatorius]|uniref:Disease resistance RPP13-like protein 3 n=1 Tax=Abrus precatorius TaxID=3816 RepID=A0A8B8L7X3_ABRPR|nr:putative disease resistance RPP13-like protein 3 [Abrus precatorius]
MVLHDVDAEIANIKNRIDEIYKNRERYGIKGASTSEDIDAIAAESLRERRKDVEEKDIVGFVNDSNSVIKKLVGEGDSGRKVASIIGMGGLGKTTLARKIYNNEQVKKCFPLRAWGYVSNDYRARELLLSLLKCLLSTYEYHDLFKKKEDEVEDIAGSEEKLKTKVRECLKGKKYFVVLDDIWKTKVWNSIEDAFPDDDDGSVGRILITSREMEVPNYVGTISPYHLPFLNVEESWHLFSKKVFRGRECPSDLEPLGRSIVETCKGLPLAIVVLAGHVSKKEKSEREWTRIKKITWDLTQDKMKVMDILKLSYDSLPQRLKPCFLYFRIYPEDYEIRARDVIQMWMAEGFIQPREAAIQGAAEPEDVAEYYLDELVDRSLVQVASRKSDGRVKTCRIHDLLRDLCISESKSEKFMDICTDPNNMDTLSNANPRRLSIQCKEWSNVSTNNLNQLRSHSLFFFSEGRDLPVRPKSFKLARLIYFKAEGLMIDWKRMVHLRYLRIESSASIIPTSIRNLRNLETLDVRFAEMVPKEIWKLNRLKHLYIRMSALKVEILPKSQRKIKGNLQTLLLTCSKGEDLVSLLNNDIFPRLRKLMFCSYYTSNKPLPSLNHLTNLHSLKINNYLELPSDANVFPSNLTKITFHDFSELGNVRIFVKNMKTVGQLASLQVLKLIKIYTGVYFDINFGDGEFPQLKVFQMRGITVKSWRLEKGAMPCRQNLVIDNCLWLEEIPEELWSLTTLREVHVSNPNRRLADRLRSVELKNGCKLILSKLASELRSEEEGIN